jgi:hypothetical protein
LSLTGGSIPIGDVGGGVYTRARSATDTPVPNATVELRTSNGTLLQTTQCDADGQFHFANVPNGAISIISTDGTTTARLDVVHTPSKSIQASLLLAEVNQNVTRLRVGGPQPPTPDAPVELTQDTDTAFTVDGEDVNGQTIADVPASWAIVGNIGEVSSEGKFHANRQGDGELTVQHGTAKGKVKIHVKKKSS